MQGITHSASLQRWAAVRLGRRSKQEQDAFVLWDDSRRDNDLTTVTPVQRPTEPDEVPRRDRESMVTAPMSTRPVTMNSHCTARPSRYMPL